MSKNSFFSIIYCLYDLINLGVPKNYQVLQYCSKVSYLKISKETKTVI